MMVVVRSTVFNTVRPPPCNMLSARHQCTSLYVHTRGISVSVRAHQGRGGGVGRLTTTLEGLTSMSSPRLVEVIEDGWATEAARTMPPCTQDNKAGSTVACILSVWYMLGKGHMMAPVQSRFKVHP